MINSKEDWKKMKGNPEMPVEVFHQCYLENGGVVKDLFEFQKMFVSLKHTQRMVQINPFTGERSERELSHATAIRKVITHFNEKYGESEGD